MSGLFEFQAVDVQALREAFQKYLRVCYQLSTGGGKTVVAGYICQELRRNDATALILVHRKELVEQFVTTLCEVGLAQDVGVIHPDYPSTPWAPIQVASVFSLIRREITFDPWLVIADEAHHVRAKTWETVLKRWPAARVLGLTATPARLDGKGLGTIFDYLHCGPTTAELVRLGRLVPMQTFRIPVGFDMKKVRTQMGDYHKKDLANQARDQRIIVNGVAAYRKYTPGKQAIFFGVDIEHSKATAERFRDEGVRAEHVDGDTPSESRKQIMRQFRDGYIKVVCNVDLISEGFDCPTCEVIMDAQHTKSITRYLQKLGRAMRTADGKREAIHLDLCGNIIHGFAEDARLWSLDQEDIFMLGEAVDGKANVAAMRCCPQCSLRLYAA